ncbi:developmental pluripotency-associated protein 3-like [Phyllostomus discolor]|uniref:Developmental pluripotency-associated protein 3-like n=1 Tax=Phyllostomus discolor TaxID=89673 RepID=A0A7E6CIE5_9CHIR|nr:developmental pluripotency-associated protein 3-like [Phyllostomus discolor]
MDSPNFNPTWTLEPFQMSDERCFADAQALSQLLARNLRKLTLDPSIQLSPLPPESSPEKQERGKSVQGPGLGLSQSVLYERRRGVRTLASIRKERMRRMLQVIRFHTLSLLKKTPEERKHEIEERARKFRCTCHYCLVHGDPSDNVNLENNYEME